MKNYSVLVFEDKMWTEIPEKENPAFKKSIFFKEGQPEWFALIICKVLPYESSVTGEEGFIVSDVSVDVPDVLRLGVFWNLENAKIFADAYVTSKQ